MEWIGAIAQTGAAASMPGLALRGAAFAALLTLSPAQAQQTKSADGYPNRMVKIVVGFGAGGGTDAVARVVAQKLQDMIGGSFLVENRPGASGRLAPDAVAKSAPDGYTLLGAAPGAMTVGTAIWDKLPYNIVKDFVPISQMSVSPMVVVVSKDHPARTVGELIAWLKANPDKANYPTPSPVFTLPIEHFKIKTGAPGAPIFYRSSNESVTSLLSGQTAFAFIETPTVMPQITAGTMRPLAVTSPSRIPDLPEVPTLAEAGVPDVVATTWFGLLAPAGTPSAIVRELETAARRIAATDDFKARMKMMSSASVGSSADEFAARMRAEVTLWTSVVKSANIKFEQ
jgi:tripartite-type tricarboxylate transporter receptor subunit TctC